jgi:PIN domain nuclease of toxin-antitoxin system
MPHSLHQPTGFPTLNPEAPLLAQLATNRFEILPVLLPHVFALSALPDHHRDPFDRILVAQAISEKAPLLTTDARVKCYPVEVMW